MDLLTTQPGGELSGSASASASGLSTGGESCETKSPSNDPVGKVRTACNRCHGQKLRCIKKPGQTKCERCRKLHTSCRFSPRAPRSSLKHSEPAIDGMQGPFPLPPSMDIQNVHVNSLLGDCNSAWLFPPNAATNVAGDSDPNMYADLCYPMQIESSDTLNLSWASPWLRSEMNTLDPHGSLDFDLVPTNNNMLSRASLLHLESPNLPSRFEHPSTCSNYPSSPIRDLANINVALHDCAGKLPSMPEVGVYPPSFSPLSTDEKQSARKVALFALDELFCLTSEFIDILKRISQAGNGTDVGRTATSNTTRLETVSPVLTTSRSPYPGHPLPSIGVTPPSGPFSDLDEATMLLIMSCHCRLVDTYVSIFRMMQACIEYVIKPQMVKDAVIILPRLQFGSHEAPAMQVDAKTMLSPDTSSMYMLMVTTFSTKLCEQLTEVIGTEQGKGRCGKAENQGISSLQSRQAMWDSMKDKTDCLARDIDRTRCMLQKAAAR